MRSLFRKALFAPLAWPILATAFFFGLAVALDCTPKEAKDAHAVVDPVVDVAGATCKALEMQPEPDWVTFACEIEQAVGPVVVGRETAPPKKITFQLRVRRQ